MIPRLGGGGPLLSLAAAHANPSLLLLHGTPARGTPPHNLAAKGLRSRWLSTAGAWLGLSQPGRPRDTPRARPRPSHLGGPCSAWDFDTMDGGAYPGDPGPPSSEILIKPAAVTGTYVTYPRLDGTRMIPRLGRGGALALVRHMQPLCLSVELPCVGLLPTILSERPPFSGSRPPAAQ